MRRLVPKRSPCAANGCDSFRSEKSLLSVVPFDSFYRRSRCAEPSLAPGERSSSLPPSARRALRGLVCPTRGSVRITRLCHSCREVEAKQHASCHSQSWLWGNHLLARTTCVSSSAVAELDLHQEGNQPPDWLPQSGGSTPIGLPPTDELLTLW